MEIYDYIHQISEQQILDLASKDGRTNNVVVGIDKHCFGVVTDEFVETCQFLYINGTSSLKGHMLQIRLEQNNFYPLIVEFAYIMSIEFDLNDPVNLYNGLIKCLRSALEAHGIKTVTNFDLRLLNEKHGESSLIVAGPMKIIYYLDKKEFYQTIVGENSPIVDVEGHYVYLIINCRNGLFKIGRSRNPLKREKTLQAEEPEVLLIKYWSADKSFESKLHKRFLQKRVRGEWFKLNINDLLELRKITSDFDFNPT